jgi:hypothetical protein
MCFIVCFSLCTRRNRYTIGPVCVLLPIPCDDSQHVHLKCWCLLVLKLESLHTGYGNSFYPSFLALNVVLELTVHIIILSIILLSYRADLADMIIFIQIFI